VNLRLAVGLAAFAGCCAVFYGAAQLAGRAGDLRARLVLAPGGDGRRLVGRLEPPRLRQRARLLLDDLPPLEATVDPEGRFELDLPRAGPGLHHLRWQVRYGGRLERQAGVAYIEHEHGPMGQACDARVIAAQPLLDQLAALLAPRLLKLARSKLQTNRVPALQSLRLALRLHRQLGIKLWLRLGFGDSGAVGIRTAFDLQPASNGALRPRLRAPVTVDLTRQFRTAVLDRHGRGAHLAALVLHLLGHDLLQGQVDAAVKEAIEQQIIPQLEQLLRPRAFPLERGRRHPRARVAFCGPTAVDRLGRLSVGLRLAVTHARLPPRRSAPFSFAGTPPATPVRFSGPEPTRSPLPRGANLALSVSPGGLNTLLDAWWRSGALRELLNRPAILAELDDALRDLTVKVAALDPQLPPVVQPPSGDRPADRLQLRAGELGLRLMPRRQEGGGVEEQATVYGALGITARVLPRRGRVALAVEVQQLAVTCLDGDDWSWRRPCYGDVAQLARETYGDASRGASLQLALELGDLVRALHAASRGAGLRARGERLRVDTLPGAGAQGPLSSRGPIRQGPLSSRGPIRQGPLSSRGPIKQGPPWLRLSGRLRLTNR